MSPKEYHHLLSYGRVVGDTEEGTNRRFLIELICCFGASRATAGQIIIIIFFFRYFTSFFPSDHA